jgi:hypothetical protein
VVRDIEVRIPLAIHPHSSPSIPDRLPQLKHSRGVFACHLLLSGVIWRRTAAC